jgi:hypothetical protein
MNHHVTLQKMGSFRHLRYKSMYILVPDFRSSIVLVQWQRMRKQTIREYKEQSQIFALWQKSFFFPFDTNVRQQGHARRRV